MRPECRDRLEASIRAGAMTNPISGRVEDLSLTGAKLFTPVPLAVDTPLELTLTCAKTRQQVSGVVRWTTPAAGKTWYVGCLFERSLDVEFFNGLAIKAILERRRHPRQSASVAASVRRELGKQTQIPVTIVDYSEGGLCLVSREPISPGDRLMIDVATSELTTGQIIARSEWSDTADAGAFTHRIGCSYVKADGCARLQKAVEFHIRTQPRRSMAPPLATLLGLGLVSGWCWMVWNDRWPETVEQIVVLSGQLREQVPEEMIDEVRTWLDTPSSYLRSAVRPD